MTTTPPTGLRRLLHAVAATARLLFDTAGLAALTVGIPWLLVRFVGNPNPWHRGEGWGSPSQAWDNLSQPIEDDTLIRLLAVIAWICWLAFVLNILGELGWYARRLPALAADTGARAAHAAHLAELPAYRMVAAVLVGGVMLTVLAMWRTGATAAAAPAAAPDHTHRPPGIAQPATIVDRHAPAPAPASVGEQYTAARPMPARSAAVGPPVPYTVQRGDTLWDIAAECLGDPLRWPEIYKLSKTLPQPDGALLGDPDLIEPGWVLHLPADATAPAADTPDPEQAPHTPTAPATPETAPPNPAQPADVPAPAAPPPGSTGPASPAAESPHRSEPTTPPGENLPAPAAPPAPAEVPIPTATADAPATTAPAVPPSAASPSDDREDEGRPVGIEVGEAGFIGVTFAAGIAAALVFARAHRRRRHRVGDAEPPPLAGIVREAQHAHLWARTADPATEVPDPDEPAHDTPVSADAAPRRPLPAAPQAAAAITVGVRGRRELTVWDVTSGSCLYRVFLAPPEWLGF
ncbi:LysM peptidoglycan-binding domain-containing protein (plasmid) [Embleya sp. NBC_00888]|uniref:LysM peptidoglycan-binding domain-containing protein n=1 Tax=Embleya sp. NBC_00888 TaxID=2975960 RepID=UPI002F90C6E6|nr:LysM peptidoglycan-binding domain-containing protein [Embleya sp. NBC_00888]